MGDGEDNREKIGQSAKRGANSGEGGAQSVVCLFTRKGEAQSIERRAQGAERRALFAPLQGKLKSLKVKATRTGDKT